MLVLCGLSHILLALPFIVMAGKEGFQSEKNQKKMKGIYLGFHF
jgi:hypothetical protein